MTTKRWIAVTFLVGLLAGVPACSSRHSGSSGSAQAVVVMDTPTASPTVPSPAHSEARATAAASTPSIPTKPFAPPRTPETAPGAHAFVRAYVAALNEMSAHDDLAVAQELSAYTFDGCSVCDAFQAMGYYNAASARRIGGHSGGNQITVTALDVTVDPATGGSADVTIGFSASRYRLIDARGAVVDAEPASTSTWLMELSYSSGAWHVATMQSAR